VKRNHYLSNRTIAHILRRAASLVEYRSSIQPFQKAYTCDAIHAVSLWHHSNDAFSQVMVTFAYALAPLKDGDGVRWFSSYDFDDHFISHENNHRVVALCFAADLIEQGELLDLDLLRY